MGRHTQEHIVFVANGCNTQSVTKHTCPLMTRAVRAALSTVNDAIVTCMRAVSECINTSTATEEEHSVERDTKIKVLLLGRV